VGVDRSELDASVRRARLAIVAVTLVEVGIVLAAAYWGARAFLRELVRANSALERVNKDLGKANDDAGKANEELGRANEELGRANEDLSANVRLLNEARDAIQRQTEEALRQNRELSTPILELGRGLIAMPIVGEVDEARVALIEERLLAALHKTRARTVIVDITGVAGMSGPTVARLSGVVHAVRLLGAECVLTGIGPGIAREIAALGVDLRGVRTLRSMEQALREWLRAAELRG
jgi:rsbT co-antagonist protein RsbR